MKSSYIDYSMSVIVGRALPDVRDGLKPAHRRVLYGMSELGLGPGSTYKKSARIVGEVLGKYHPHGDASVYDTMVRMAQEFSLRYPLVDGQGNFGSIDGDSAAAMRYTEARMTRLADEMLRDLNQDTTDFQENFDGSLEEPSVLPAAVPNLLINGGDGIAVGMATKIPPHNLGEIVDAVNAFIDDPDIDTLGLMEYVPGPDFPTGGIIYGHGGIQEAYHTGRGRVVIRARIHEEEVRPGRQALIITEIPYQINKSSLVEKIAGLVRDKRIVGISDLRDESDREGMRIVIELRKDAMPQVVQNKLFKYSDCQRTFGANLVALVDGRPRTLTLKDAIRHFVNHRHEVVIRRTRFQLRKAEERAHILEWLDAVITIIRHSDDTDAARINLMQGSYPGHLTTANLERLGLDLVAPGETDHGREVWLTEVQANAILALRLSRLTGLERQKIEIEYKEVQAKIERLYGILKSEPLRMQIIKDELSEIRKKYADERRSAIDYSGSKDFVIEDLIVNRQEVVTISHQGLIKRTSMSEFHQQGRGGIGRRGGGLRDDDYLEHLLVSHAHDYLLFFTDHGLCYWLRVYQIPEGSRVAKGRSIRNLIQIEQSDRIRTVLSVSKENFRDPEFLDSRWVLMATRNGWVKKSPLRAYSRPKKTGIRAINITDGDEVVEAQLTDGEQEVLLASTNGFATRFPEHLVRSTGRVTQGVRGIRLSKGEHVVGMVINAVVDQRDLLTLSANGYGKRSQLADYPVTKTRSNKGVSAMKTTPKTGPLVAIKGVLETSDLMIVTEGGTLIRTQVGAISLLGRRTQGVRVIRLKEGDAIADVTRFIPEEPNGVSEVSQEG